MKKNMKELLHSKKVKLALTGTALAVMGLGTTYAWWTASTETSSTVTFGTLKMKTDFPGLSDQVDYEPGLYLDSDGTIENTGTQPLLAKVSNGSEIQFALDADGNAIADADKKSEAVDPNAIQLIIQPTNYEEAETNCWYTDDSGSLYALVDAGATATLHVTENFDGEKCTNQYQGAVVKAKIKVDATQVQPEQAKSQFGTDMEDNGFRPYDGRTRSDNSAYREKAMNFLHKMLNR